MTDQDITGQFDQENDPTEKEGFLEPAHSEESIEQKESGEENVEARLQAENEDLEDKLTRTQAELVNFRRRTQNEAAQFRKYEGLNLVRDLLPAIDNLKRAAEASEQATSFDNLKQGVDMVIQQFRDIISKHSIEMIPATGEVFDPNVHEAIQQIPSEEIPAMHVVQELETGYRMHDRIVRPVKVIVSTGSPETTEE